jgi:hypothetical protein
MREGVAYERGVTAAKLKVITKGKCPAEAGL